MNFLWELSSFVQKEWDCMYKEEKCQRLKHSDPTFTEYVLSCIKKGDIVYIGFKLLYFWKNSSLRRGGFKGWKLILN